MASKKQWKSVQNRAWNSEMALEDRALVNASRAGARARAVAKGSGKNWFSANRAAGKAYNTSYQKGMVKLDAMTRSNNVKIKAAKASYKSSRAGSGVISTVRGAAVKSDKAYAARTGSFTKAYGAKVMKHDAVARGGVVALRKGGGAIRSL